MLTEKLLAIDPVIIAVYLVVSLLLGIFGSRLLGMNNSKEDDYYLAGRKMPGWLNGMSVAATALNSDVAPLYCGIAVVTGLSGCWFFLSRFGMALLLAAILFAVRWRQMGIRTGPEFFHLRFGAGNKFARVYSSLTSVLIGMVPWDRRGTDRHPSGRRPDLRDRQQGGHAADRAAAADRLRVDQRPRGRAADRRAAGLRDPRGQSGDGRRGAVGVRRPLRAGGGGDECGRARNRGAILSILPQAGNPVLSPLSIFAWMLIVSVGAGSAVGADGQRLFSCRSNREAAKVGIWGEVILFAMLLMLMLPAMGLLARHPEFTRPRLRSGSSPTERCSRNFCPEAASA